MAEHPFSMQDEEDVRWNSLGTNPSTDPAAGEKDAGWAVNDIPPSSDENWFRTWLWNEARWNQGNSVRAFDYIHEAIADPDIAFGQRFDVRLPEASRPLSTASIVHNVYLPNLIAADGEQVYTVSQASSSTRAWTPTLAGLVEGQENWTATPHVITVSAIDAPGEYVYLAYNTGVGLQKVIVLDAATGVTVTAAIVDAYAGAIPAIVSNANWVAWIRPDNQVEIRDAVTLLNPRLYNPGVPIYDLATDDEHVYLVSDQYGGGNFDVTAVLGATAAMVWQVSITNGFSSPSGVCCDGEWVYVSGGIGAALGGNMFKLDRFVGLNSTTGFPWYEIVMPLWGGSSNKVICDDKYLFSWNPTHEGYTLIDKREGAVLRSAAYGAPGPVYDAALDGTRYYLVADTPANRVLGVAPRGIQTKTFIRADPADDSRRPFYKLALPVQNQ